jgi:hypothetical protein
MESRVKPSKLRVIHSDDQERKRDKILLNLLHMKPETRDQRQLSKKNPISDIATEGKRGPSA